MSLRRIKHILFRHIFTTGYFLDTRCPHGLKSLEVGLSKSLAICRVTRGYDRGLCFFSVFGSLLCGIGRFFSYSSAISRAMVLMSWVPNKLTLFLVVVFFISLLSQAFCYGNIKLSKHKRHTIHPYGELIS